MKKTLLVTLLLTTALVAHAQLKGDGFYRVQNVVTGRYAKVADNRGSLNYTAATADLKAIRTIRDFQNVVSDPGTVIYIEEISNEDSPRYDLKAQGTGVHEIIGHYGQIKETRKGGTYQAFATAYGMTAYIADEYYLVNGEFEEVGVLDEKETRTREWWIHPMSQEDGRYFGIKPEWNNGATYYSTFYASFPFSFYSTGMKAYYICNIDIQHGIAVWKEVTGDIPASMPVIIASSTNNPATNRLDIHTSDLKAASDNLLRGIYFDLESGPHANRTAYDAKTMRVFGKLADGSLGFKKSDITYIPANKAYLPVPASAPDELKIMTNSEYEAFLASIEENKRDTVIVRVNNATKVYGEDNPQFTYTLENAPEGVSIETLAAQPLLATEAGKFSDVGTYAITASGAAMDKCVFIYINGTLTITEASVVVRVNDATRTYGQDNPQFSYTLENAPENVTMETLHTHPALTTEATKTSPVGTYAIKASGAAMSNCVFTYIDGTLTVTEASVTIRARNATRAYGQENPNFTYTLENAPEGVTNETLRVQPKLTTEATKTSDVGTYAIKVSGAEMDNCVFTYIDGTLTVTVATVTIRVNDASKVYGEDNPTFTYTLEKAPEGLTAETLLKQPTLSTTATKESDAGSYIITASGAEAKNCTFKYINGVFTINKIKQVLDCSVKERDVTIEVEKTLEFAFSNVILTPIECKVSDEEILSVSGSTNNSFGITALKEGYATVTFSQAGDKNHEAAILVFYVTTVSSGIQNAVSIDNVEVYDLLGRKVEDTSKLKGIYIVNGRKIIF